MFSRCMKIALILSIGIITVCSAITFSQDRNIVINEYKRAFQFFNKGVELFKNDQLKQSREQFEKALGAMPQYAEASFFMGLTYQSENKHNDALTHFENAKKKYIEWQNVKVQVQSMDYQDAQDKIMDIRQQIEIQQGKKVGQPQSVQSQIDTVIAGLERNIRTLERIPEPEAVEPVIPAKYHFQSANCYLKLQKWNEAYQNDLQALDVDPNHAEAHQNLAYIYYLAKQYENSWKHIELAEKNGATVPQQVKDMVIKELNK